MNETDKMDPKVAQHVCRSAFRHSREISELLPFLKLHCSEAQYKEMLDAIAGVVDEIRDRIIEPLLADDPQLRQDIEIAIEKYGVIV